MWYDLIVLAILGYAVVRGAAKGIVWQLAVIAALVFCFAFAGTLSSTLAPYMGVEPPLNRWIAMFVLYAGFTFLAFGIARLLREWLEKAKFVEYDRHLGAVLGFLKGAVFALVATFFVVTLSEAARAHVMNSYSGYAAAIVMDRLHPVLPEELHDVLDPYIHQLDRPDMDLRHAHDDDHADQHTDGHSHDETAHDTEDNSSGEQDPLRQIISTLPAIFDPELKQLAYEALSNTSPEHRDQLVEKLSSGIPGLVRAVALDWINGKPDENEFDPTERERLLEEISAVYSDYPPAQETIVEEIEMSLRELPDRVSIGVLRDWHSDLLALESDPDPETGMVTPLDERIIHQLSLARVSISSLPETIQDRLRETLPR